MWVGLKVLKYKDFFFFYKKLTPTVALSLVYTFETAVFAIVSLLVFRFLPPFLFKCYWLLPTCLVVYFILIFKLVEFYINNTFSNYRINFKVHTCTYLYILEMSLTVRGNLSVILGILIDYLVAVTIKYLFLSIRNIQVDIKELSYIKFSIK